MSIPKIDVFNYHGINELLKDCLLLFSSSESGIADQEFSKQLGFVDTQIVKKWLNGSLVVTVTDIDKVAQFLKLNAVEKFYLHAMVAFQRNEDELPINKKFAIESRAVDPKTNKEFFKAEISDFEVISHWKYTAILACTNVEGVVSSEANIIKMFSSYFSEYEVRHAIGRLLSIGLLLDQGGVLVSAHKKVTGRDEHSNLGIRLYHKSTCQLASDKLDTIPLSRREMQSYTLNIPKDKVSVAKKMIKDFRQKFVEEVGCSSDASEVYQFNMHLFPIISEDEMLACKTRGVDEAVC